MRIKMLDELARKKVFTVKEATRISGITETPLKLSFQDWREEKSFIRIPIVAMQKFRFKRG